MLPSTLSIDATNFDSLSSLAPHVGLVITVQGASESLSSVVSCFGI